MAENTNSKKFNKAEKSWIMYDWANSVYATNMLAAIFPIFFGLMCKQAGLGGQDNTILLSACASVTNLIVAILAPILGALGDHKGYKKKLFGAFMLIGVVFTLWNAIFVDYKMLMVGYTLSHIGFSGSCLFYDSFLTDVTTPERMDKVSTWGYAMGYIGGSTIPFVISIVILFVMGMDNAPAFRLVMVLTALWWLVFSIPTLLNVKQVHYVEGQDSLVRSSLSNLWKTAKEIFKNKSIFLFILAYFFYIDGVGTVISVSTSYGTTLGLDSVGMVLALLVTQIVAVPFSILFGKLSDKVGSIKLLLTAVAIYIGICCVGFFMGFNIERYPVGTESYEKALALSNVLFWCMAFMVGTVQGGIQAISRSYFGKLIPAERSNEFFGFFDIFGKFAAVVGPALMSFFTLVTGRASVGILSLIVLFGAGFVILFFGRKTVFAKTEG